MKNFTPARRELVAAGWKRCDRHNQELWSPPWDGEGARPGLVTFASARRRYLKTTRRVDATHAAVDTETSILAFLRGFDVGWCHPLPVEKAAKLLVEEKVHFVRKWLLARMPIELRQAAIMSPIIARIKAHRQRSRA